MLHTLSRIEARSAVALLVIIVVILVVPKVNLFSFGPYVGAGLRIEDFLIFVFFLLVFPLWFWYAKKITQLEAMFFLFVAISLVSLLANLPFGRGSILYGLRLVEYWALFYGGVLAARFGIGERVLFWLLVANCVAIGLQYFHLAGGWSNGVYFSELARPTGLTNGAYEAPFVVGIIAIFLMRRMRGWRLYSSILLAFTAISMTGARIVLVGYLLAVLLSFLPTRSKAGPKQRSRVLIPATALALVVAITLFLVPQVFERFDGLTDIGLIREEVQQLYVRAQGERNGATGEEFARSQLNVKTQDVKSYIEEDLSLSTDLSLLVRTNKWFWGAKSFINQGVVVYLTGLGPGTMGNALDGGFLRIAIETGLLGIVVFLAFLYQIIKLNRHLLLPCIAFFIICNFVIDYYLASKPMMTFFFVVGVSLGITRNFDDLASTS